MGISEQWITAIGIGVGATLVMDGWSAVSRRLGVSTLDYALVGRWAGHALRGRWRHQAIRQAPPIKHERILGWTLHYVIGVAFAMLLVITAGTPWLSAPTLWPALAVGAGTVLAPLCLMQPAMGMGFFASRTPSPWRARFKSLVNHLVFGIGMYVTALAL
ncbi:DUF2938 domain-containing protein [Pseudomonas sp. FYR_7]|uniref:DUF2938 domain-containing protein n=1 Tax=Pseudomonas sp. FYR_7 TaxID=3367174 RepID=UPI00370CBFBB